MRARAAAAPLAALGVLAALAAGCAATPEPVSRVEGGAIGDLAGRSWSGRLVPRTTPAVRGTVEVVPSDAIGQKIATIRLETTPSNAGVHAWRIVRGSCDVTSGTVVGSPALFPVIRVEGNGIGEATAAIPLGEERGSLSARVYASPTNYTLIACGDLR